MLTRNLSAAGTSYEGTSACTFPLLHRLEVQSVTLIQGSYLHLSNSFSSGNILCEIKGERANDMKHIKPVLHNVFTFTVLD